LIAKLCLFHGAFLQPDASRERRESYQVFMLIPGHSGIRNSHHRPRLKLRQQPACGPVGMAVRVAVICSAAKPAVRVGQTGRGRPRRVFQASQLILRLLTNSLAPMGAAISSAPSAEMLNCCARSLSLPLVTLKNHRGDPLGSFAALAQRNAVVPRGNAAPANAAFNTGLATGDRNDYTGPAIPARGGALWSSEGRN
jgi:hypothetical protein